MVDESEACAVILVMQRFVCKNWQKKFDIAVFGSTFIHA
jgi:hypothetical protein